MTYAIYGESIYSLDIGESRESIYSLDIYSLDI